MSRRHAYLLAAALTALVVSIELLLSGTSGASIAFIVSGLAVVLVASNTGFWPGALVTAASATGVDYFVLGPGVLLDFTAPFSGLELALFVAGSLAVCTLLDRQLVSRSRDAMASAAAERARAHAERIAQLTAALGCARSAAAVVDAAVREPLQSLKGDAAMLCLVGEDGSSATVGLTIGYEAASAPVDSHRLGDSDLMRDVVRRRSPVTFESREACIGEYGAGGDVDVSDGYEAAAVVPVMAGGRVVAVIRIEFRDRRVFTEDELAFLEALSRHAGKALERAWQQESDQRARVEAEGLRERADQELARRQTIEQALRSSETRYRALASRTTRLHALTAALSEAVTIEAVARAIVQQGTVVVGATACDVLTLAEGEPSADAAASGTAGLRRFSPEPGSFEADVVSTRRPVFVKSWDEAQTRYWRSASAAADAAYTSSAALPLLVNTAVTGVLRFDFSAPVNFDEEYRALLVSVAQHCSQALDRARLYESAQRARAEAEAASRLKDDFLSIVSHELRTPLNAVMGWAAILQKSTLDPAVARRAVHSIHDNATRQAKLIDDLLDVSRIAAGGAALDCQPVDVPALVGGVVESLLPVAASSGVELRLVPLAPAYVLGDRRRLEQVFFNLLGNALKFTPTGGTIVIDSECSDGGVDVRIQDDGVGIAPEFLPHVFDRFRQADSTSTRSYGGLGLGLSIAKQLVEAHKGRITVDSEGKGLGTLFTVRLPRTDGGPIREIPDVPTRRMPADAPHLPGTRVLVVDDELDAREVMAHTLRHHGAQVSVAATAPEAYALMTADRFDVLLADIAMPGEDGCSLIRRIRASVDPRVALIRAAAVTAHAGDEERRNVVEAGFQMHLVKPIEPADLVRAVSDLALGGADVALTAG